jgi:hypothetical protein
MPPKRSKKAKDTEEGKQALIEIPGEPKPPKKKAPKKAQVEEGDTRPCITDMFEKT